MSNEKESIRKRNIKYILEVLPSIGELEELGDPIKLPLLDLYGACLRYENKGYSDCIMLAASAVELALFLEMDQTLKKEEKEKLMRKEGLGFSSAIEFAKKEKLFSEEEMEKAWILHNLRNMFAHPGNWVAYIKNLEAQIPELIKKLSPIIEKEAKEIIELPLFKEMLEEMKLVLEREIAKKLSKIPNLSWTANQDTLKFQNRSNEQYFEEIVKDFMKKENILKFYESEDLVTYIKEKYDYNERISLEALGISYTLLNKLKFVKKI